jgi:O-acetylhomoserine (thiol)-lyase
VGGVILVGNDFPWPQRAEKFPKLREYFADAGGKVVLPQNPFGAMVSKISLHEGSGVIAPDTAMSIADALPSMESRVEKMCQNARGLADILADHRNVGSVQLAGYMTDSENDARTKHYLGENHFVLLVDLKHGANAATSFINSDQFLHAVALGQNVTAVSHPPSSTHRSYTVEELAKMGIRAGTIRISVGCEEQEALNQKMITALTF